MAISPCEFFEELSLHDISFYSGVPDSLLKEFCFCIDDRMNDEQHIIAANEGNAIALATGYHLATNKLPMVYMQNSGLGNAINPLLSLCDPDVYSIPLIVMIGWRGEPGVKDEPQHTKQGKVQINLLKAMDLPFETISKDDDQFQLKISNIVDIAKNENRPVVLLIKKGTFDKYSNKLDIINNHKLKREKALEIILENLSDNAIIVSTTGKTSREIFEIREKRGQAHNQDFLTVGSMGHCSLIALGIAISKPNREIICIDGDGAMLMHLGSLTTIAAIKPNNFRHILLNNEVHESVGGQKTAAQSLNMLSIVGAIGTNKVFVADSENLLKKKILELIHCDGPSFLEVKIQPGSRDNLGRPTIKPIKNKTNFMNFINKN